MTLHGPLMRVTFRVAASGTVGAGHAARCCGLAEALRALRARIRWACDAGTAPFLQERGVPGGELCPEEYEATGTALGERPASDQAQRLDAARTLRSGPSDWIVADSYALGPSWHREARSSGARVAVFDDLMDRTIDADLVINAAADAGAYRALAPEAREACGLRWAIVGDPRRPPAAGRGSLLLAFGAADPANLAGATLRALGTASLRSMPVVLQLGASAPARADVEAAMAALPRATFAPGGPTSPGQPLLAIGAAGVGLLERMHAGIPNVVVVAAANQRALAAAAERSGSAVTAATPSEAVAVAGRLLTEPSRLRDMSDAGRMAVDGHGAHRIARAMNRLSGVRLRRAGMHDAHLLHAWRNHPSVRAASHQGGEIPWETHVKWLEDSLARTDRHVLVAERRGHPVGTLRFDVAGESATVSIAVEPGLQGAGFGPAILDAGHAWIPSHDSRVRRIRAEIRDGNTASVGAFIAAGYSGGPNTYERPIGRGAEP